jgi:hypothetical protein
MLRSVHRCSDQCVWVWVCVSVSGCVCVGVCLCVCVSVCLCVCVLCVCVVCVVWACVCVCVCVFCVCGCVCVCVLCVYECAFRALYLPSRPANWTATLGSITGQQLWPLLLTPLASCTGSTTGKQHWPALVTPRAMLKKCFFQRFEIWRFRGPKSMDFGPRQNRPSRDMDPIKILFF